MDDVKRYKPATLSAQALGWIDERTRAVIPPLHVATTFVRDEDNQYRAGYEYARDGHPAFDQAESLLQTLEGGAGCRLFSSGLTAATTAFLALRPGDHVVAPKVMYWGLRTWLQGFARDWSLAVDFVDTSDAEAISKCVRPGQTKLVWIETPGNPIWTVTDIAAAAKIAHDAGARLAVDNTVPTPILTRPIEFGADLVMHSATKYLNGHSDVMAGALVTAKDDDYWQRIRDSRTSMGGIIGPFAAWLLVRGCRTLALRVERSCRSAAAIAERFSRHPNIEAVLYPGLPTHAGHEIAARQMSGGFGGMLSIRVRGGENAAVRTASRVRLWKRATSLGGVESLIEHRASVEGAGSPAPPDLLRLSVGIEDVNDLIDDLNQALEI